MLPRARLAVLAACLAAGGLALLRAGPPAPRSDAPLHEFSALRAHERLVTLLADGAPHPVGTAANAAVRARLVEQLRALGLTPRELPAFSCTDYGNCGPVVNVLVEVPGTGPGPALLLASHFDSVPAAPGAADDGHGVAVMLEVLRVLLADGPSRAPLLAVFTDGEEAGLLGARAFAGRPEFAEVGVVVNIEARGTGGLARMFETSDGNASLIAAYAAGAARPSAHSLSYEIYRRLPNDTDLTIFKAAGAQGLGFAFIGGVQRYHTPLDDLAHLDPGSLQHQGDSVLGLTRALLAAGPRPPAGNASYADLLGLVLLRWPAALDLPLAGLALLSLLAAAWLARRTLSSHVPSDSRDDSRATGNSAHTPVERLADAAARAGSLSAPDSSDRRGDGAQPAGALSAPDSSDRRGGAAARAGAASASDSADAAPPARALSAPALSDRPVRVLGVVGAAATAVVTPLLAGGVAFALIELLARASQPFARWTAAWTIALVTVSLAASAVSVLVLGLVAGRVGARGQALGVWIVWAVLACVVAVVLPGASILLIAPALLAGVGLLAAGRRAGGRTFACAAAGALACGLWPPLVPALLDALGLDPPVLGALVGWTWTVASPALAGRAARRLAAALALAAVVVGGFAAAAPRITAEMPGRLNIMHVQDLDTGAAQHVLDPYDELPPEFAAHGPWRADVLPWSTRTVYMRPAPARTDEGPTFTPRASEARGELRQVTGTLRARPGATSLTVVLPADAALGPRLGGETLDPAKLRRAAGDRRQISIMGPPPDGLELVAEVRGDAPWLLIDAVPGVHESAAALSDARLPARTRHQSGDQQISLRAFTP